MSATVIVGFLFLMKRVDTGVSQNMAIKKEFTDMAATITIIILSGILCIFLLIGMFIAISEREFGGIVLCFVALILMSAVLSDGISSACNGNQQEVEYRFPAEHYRMTMEVTVTEHEAMAVNGEFITVIERDTTYVLTGIDPIYGDEHYERNTKRLHRK